ncbi:hypothetical protein QBC47DRAFT_115502 [Echria macrotheca]|uniref:Stress response protein NST1 n=1 Tax=Echria macrotheca TaxID=438768 RepID=A0AAJ0FDW2_9PEZI|nr:hypothetical protein QBC47DRAFT_115502 [Echria macrotheca]
MKGSQRPPQVGIPSPAPPSPNSKATAKYTNKDGSKYITVPKSSTPVHSSQSSPTGTHPSAPTSQSGALGTGAVANAGLDGPVQPVNRKKQKRRAKAAAKAAAEQAQSVAAPKDSPIPPGSSRQHSGAPSSNADQNVQAEPQHAPGVHVNGFAQGETAQGKKSKKKKKKPAATDPQHKWPDAVPPTPPGDGKTPMSMSKDRIWNTSSEQERERIKEFWLGLDEDERKSLVKVEKDAVLKKMKEQQKHTCSCTVCGRKRTAIEEELEGLYNAYYEELEQYARPQPDGRPPRLSAQPHGGNTPSYSGHQPSQGHIVEHVGDEDEGEEVAYSVGEAEDDGTYSDDGRSAEEAPRSGPPTDFLGFGNSLTVQGRREPPILPWFLQGTREDDAPVMGTDLLKNDGKKFIEMMEQLAERRMRREQEVTAPNDQEYGHPNGDRFGHPHIPPEEEEYDEDEEYDEEEDEEDYESGEDEDNMTEEQRMEEGRRMFQIFAARMFEQRVLTAYKDKVAKERQAKLIEEELEEQMQKKKLQEKKAKEKEKKKDRAARKKEALAEKEALKEEAKAAEEKARQAEEARKAEEQRAKAEEKRKKREMQKKADEEEKQRKEAERLRRLHEREEAERKAREAKEREKKAREEARLKEKEIREQKEREARERKEQQERDKREKEAKAKASREAKAADREREKENSRLKDDKVLQKAAVPAAAVAAVPVPITLPKRPAPPTPAAVPALPQQPPVSYSSPQIPVATPAFPKAPTPSRNRQASHQETGTTTSSHSGSAPSQNPSPHPVTPVHASPGPIGPPGKMGLAGIQAAATTFPPSHPASPSSGSANVLPSSPASFSLPHLGTQYPHATSPHPPPGYGSPVHREPAYSSIPAPYRNMGHPPGFVGAQGRNFGIPPPPGFPGIMEHPSPAMSYGPTASSDPMQSHSRQGSGSFDPGPLIAPPQPISRPGPIGRPSSTVSGQRMTTGSSAVHPSEADDQHLGSKALLDPNDGPLDNSHTQPPRQPLLPPAAPQLLSGLPPNSFLDQVYPQLSNPWPPVQRPAFFSQPAPSYHAGMQASWGPVAPTNLAFAGPGRVERPPGPANVSIRKSMCQICAELGATGFVPLDEVEARLRTIFVPTHLGRVDLMAITETEGDSQNGGGFFDVKTDESGKIWIRWERTDGSMAAQPIQRAIGAPGHLGESNSH